MIEKTGGKNGKANESLRKEFGAFIGKRDKSLDVVTRGDRTRKLYRMAEMLKSLPNDESLQYDVEEFTLAWGEIKKTKAFILQTLKRFGVPNPRLGQSHDKVHIWHGADVVAK